MDVEEKLNAVMIFEIVGRPPEHLVETLKKIIDEISKEKGVSIISKQIKEPVLMKDQIEFYTTFAEVELNVEDSLRLAVLMFKYMPAHIEVSSPEKINLSNNDFNDILNELTRRLHSYDEIARLMQIENQNLMKKFKEIEEGKKEVKKLSEGKKGKRRNKNLRREGNDVYTLSPFN